MPTVHSCVQWCVTISQTWTHDCMSECCHRVAICTAARVDMKKKTERKGSLFICASNLIRIYLQCDGISFCDMLEIEATRNQIAWPGNKARKSLQLLYFARFGCSLIPKGSCRSPSPVCLQFTFHKQRSPYNPKASSLLTVKALEQPWRASSNRGGGRIFF